eukprot:7290710-Pyramimonas_sp.AAC.1
MNFFRHRCPLAPSPDALARTLGCSPNTPACCSLRTDAKALRERETTACAFPCLLDADGSARRFAAVTHLGIKKANVFPEPVRAAPSRSRPASRVGMDLACTSVINWNFMSLIACKANTDRRDKSPE